MSAEIRKTGDCLAVAGKMTLETARVLHARGTQLLGKEVTRFDLAAVEEVDSSALAVLFAWQRAAKAQGRSIRIANPPENLLSLAEVYGVRDLLPLS